MSDVMLFGVLRMPPELWSGDPIDVTQRHSRYVQAADLIVELQAENAALRRACEHTAYYSLDSVCENVRQVCMAALQESK